ncbi:DUF3761 domain-containing protein [Nocardia sp. NPDC052254]|uniref:DUF3761 domain-containing protein n=1 Tax=Nocardia sp. NPDC052254 TaxID=3155681 RepID=UPI0034128D7F
MNSFMIIIGFIVLTIGAASTHGKLRRARTASRGVLAALGVAALSVILAGPATALPATQPIAVHQITGCGPDSYVNADGQCVLNPGAAPAGATAQCSDGSYSFSQHESGTCSGHGGVARWL